MTDDPSAQDRVRLTTRTGFTFEVRPAHPGDEAALGAFFARVSQDDLRFRFLSASPKVSEGQIEAMTHVDHRITEDFLVFEPGSQTIIASAMLAGDERLDAAEVAVSIDAGFKGRGVGWTLLEHVARCARARGFRRLQSIESRANHAAIELEQEMGFTARPFEDDPALVLLEFKLA